MLVAGFKANTLPSFALEPPTNLMPENVFTIKGMLKKNNSGQVLKD
jgi:hypothetical protein